MNINLKRMLCVTVATAMTLISISIPTLAATTPKAKNVIMLIPDGMSIGATALARYKLDSTGETDLTMSEYATALVKSSWANGPITDSAPAGTAYSTGNKSISGALGIDANKIPKATILEVAQLKGKATGLVATSEWMHATPAAFSSHEEKRSNYANIAEQMLNQNIDVLLGTGSAKVAPTTFDILTTANAKGYTVVNNKAEMLNATSNKIWGDFTATIGGKNNMSYDLDRNVNEEPSLEEMTKKAIDILSKDQDGFFLMVEGSKIDWAAHANDTAGIVGDTLAFDKAFKAAVDFAQADGNTVVVSVTDHGNSGISIGNYNLNGYDRALFSILDPIKGATKSAEGALALLPNTDDVLRAYGIDPADTTVKVKEAIDAFKSTPNSNNLVKTLNEKAYIGYSTYGHTGEDLPLYVYAPSNIEAPIGLIDNTDVAKFMADSLDVNLDDATNELFVDVTSKGTYNSITKEFSFTGRNAKIKANQSYATIDGASINLDGQVAVFIDNKFYAPKKLVNLVNKSLDLVARYSTGVTNLAGGVAEIVKFNTDNNKFYIVNGASKKLDIVSIANVQAGTFKDLTAEKSIDLSALITTIDTTFTYGDLTSVEINIDRDYIAVAVQEADYSKDGYVAILSYDGSLIKLVKVGIQPDMLIFSKDGKYILTANEGEPRQGYVVGSTDPKGSISIIDLDNNYQATNLDFTAFDSQRQDLINKNVIIKKNTNPSVDLEPEYITVSGNKAYVTLQEANAIATIDIPSKSITKIQGLGFKDHGKAGNEIDIYRDAQINIKTEPNFRGTFNPDGISSYVVDGKTYLLTANEGDSRDWNGYLNEKDVQIAATGRDGGTKAITVTTFDTSDYDGNFELGKTYLFGARSYSIWDADTMQIVYDSGSDIERITASKYPSYFNWSNDDIVMEKRSAKKGPEQEDVQVGVVDGKPYAFIGLERIGGNVVYDISNPQNPLYVTYTNTRDFSSVIKGDVSPEGQCFISAEKSPIGMPMLLVANEVSGTVAVFTFNETGAVSPKALPQIYAKAVNSTQSKADINNVEYVITANNMNGYNTLALEFDVSSNMTFVNATKLDEKAFQVDTKLENGKLKVLVTYVTPHTTNAETNILKIEFAINQDATANSSLNLTILKSETSTTTETVNATNIAPIATTVVTQYSKYDLNKDNLVDTKDLSIALISYQAKSSDSNWNNVKVADTNSDDKIDISDIADIIKNINWL